VSTLGLKGIVWPLISGANPPKKVNVSEMRPASIRLSVRIACHDVCAVRERRVSYVGKQTFHLNQILRRFVTLPVSREVS
jgi:hypothetical protein